MAKNNNKTVFQRLTDTVRGVGNGTNQQSVDLISSSYNFPSDPTVLYQFKNEKDRDTKLEQLRQDKLMSYMWVKNAMDSTVIKAPTQNMVRVMYRDSDLMDGGFPEIGTALDIMSEEATTINEKGIMLHIDSTSDRIKSILEDLFVNRLDIHVMLPMIARAMCKYGNEFMMLNVSSNGGVLGWRELPVYEMRRLENGIDGMYGKSAVPNNAKFDDVSFIWEGHNETMPYKNWQVAHFRLINNSVFLPYGSSVLHKVRRVWRMLSMMEDALLLYRLERSIERRVFKVNVGLMDEKDVPAWLNQFANTFKRAPIIDPQTGQLDLRKNFLDVSADYFIPVRSGQDPTSIESLNSLQNPTGIEDLEYMKAKVLAGLKMPKTFLNFQEAQGKGQNLSLMDVRFSRTVVVYQQALLMELTKIAIIHLYLLGFTEDLTNFTLSLNNPSNQIESYAIEKLQNKLNAATTALQEQPNGLALMSWHQVQREIMGKTNQEIVDMLNEMRLETALGLELKMTYQIINRTHIFDKVDRIYGKLGAEYTGLPEEEGPGGGGFGGGGGGLAGGFGDDLGGFDEPGGEGVDFGGAEGTADLADMGGGEEAAPPLTETKKRRGRKSKLDEESKKLFLEKYIPTKDEKKGIDKIIGENFIVNEQINDIINDMEQSITSAKTLNENEE